MIFFVGKIKFYDEIVNEITEISHKILNGRKEFDMVFIWSSEEGEIFWDLYRDVIKIGIPLEKRCSKEIIENKIIKVVKHWEYCYKNNAKKLLIFEKK